MEMESREELLQSERSWNSRRMQWFQTLEPEPESHAWENPDAHLGAVEE